MSNPFLEDVIKTVDFKEGFGFRYSLSVRLLEEVVPFLIMAQLRQTSFPISSDTRMLGQRAHLDNAGQIKPVVTIIDGETALQGKKSITP